MPNGEDKMQNKNNKTDMNITQHDDDDDEDDGYCYWDCAF